MCTVFCFFFIKIVTRAGTCFTPTLTDVSYGVFGLQSWVRVALPWVFVQTDICSLSQRAQRPFFVLILRCACVCAPLSLTVCFCHRLYLCLQDRAAWESQLWWTRCLSLKSAVALCCLHPRRRSPKQLKLSPSVTVWKPPSPLVCQPIDVDLLLLCLILLYPFTFFSFFNLTLYVLLVWLLQTIQLQYLICFLSVHITIKATDLWSDNGYNTMVLQESPRPGPYFFEP